MEEQKNPSMEDESHPEDSLKDISDPEKNEEKNYAENKEKIESPEPSENASPIDQKMQLLEAKKTLIEKGNQQVSMYKSEITGIQTQIQTMILNLNEKDQRVMDQVKPCLEQGLREMSSLINEQRDQNEQLKRQVLEMEVDKLELQNVILSFEEKLDRLERAMANKKEERKKENEEKNN